MLTLLSLVTCVCVHWGLNPTIGSRALLFFFPSIIHLSLLSRFHLIHYWRRNATRVWIKRPFFFVYWRRGTTEQKKKDGTGRYWVLHLEERNCQFACLFSTRRRDDFFLFFLSYFSIQSTFFFYLGPSIEMAVYTLERERANKRLLYYWFSLHLGHFW